MYNASLHPGALPSYSAFLSDYLAAADTIISSGRQDQVTGALLKTGRQGMQASVGGARYFVPQLSVGFLA